MAILIECEKKHPEGALSKRDFARQLAEVANEIDLEKDKELLRYAVHLLDNESEPHNEIIIHYITLKYFCSSKRS